MFKATISNKNNIRNRQSKKNLAQEIEIEYF